MTCIQREKKNESKIYINEKENPQNHINRVTFSMHKFLRMYGCLLLFHTKRLKKF